MIARICVWLVSLAMTAGVLLLPVALSEELSLLRDDHQQGVPYVLSQGGESKPIFSSDRSLNGTSQSLWSLYGFSWLGDGEVDVDSIQSHHARDWRREVFGYLQRYYFDAERVQEPSLHRLSREVLCDLSPSCLRSRGRVASHLYNVSSADGRGESGGFKASSPSLPFSPSSPSSRSFFGSADYLQKLVAKLDHHSRFLFPEEYQEFQREHAGVLSGIGVRVHMVKGMLLVDEVYAGSSALEQGLEKGDHVLYLDHKPTFGASLQELSRNMSGLPGSEVELVVLKEKTQKKHNLTIQRRMLTFDNVKTEWLQDTASSSAQSSSSGYLYIDIEHFREGSVQKIQDEIQRQILYKQRDLGKAYNPELLGVVIDLRGNPGGLLTEAVKFVDLFLDEGIIVATTMRDVLQSVYRASKAATVFPETKVVVLVDRYAASASEIVAQALKYHGRAVVMGQPTYGKSSIQSLFELSGGAALKLTVGHFFVPTSFSSQKSVQAYDFKQSSSVSGVLPDVWVMPYRQSQPLYQWVDFPASFPASFSARVGKDLAHRECWENDSYKEDQEHSTDQPHFVYVKEEEHKEDSFLVTMAVEYLRLGMLENMPWPKQEVFWRSYGSRKFADQENFRSCSAVELKLSEDSRGIAFKPPFRGGEPFIELVIENPSAQDFADVILHVASTLENALQEGYLIGNIPAFSQAKLRIPMYLNESLHHHSVQTFQLQLISKHRYILAKQVVEVGDFGAHDDNLLQDNHKVVKDVGEVKNEIYSQKIFAVELLPHAKSVATDGFVVIQITNTSKQKRYVRSLKGWDFVRRKKIALSVPTAVPTGFWLVPGESQSLELPAHFSQFVSGIEIHYDYRREPYRTQLDMVTQKQQL